MCKPTRHLGHDPGFRTESQRGIEYALLVALEFPFGHVARVSEFAQGSQLLEHPRNLVGLPRAGGAERDTRAFGGNRPGRGRGTLRR